MTNKKKQYIPNSYVKYAIEAFGEQGKLTHEFLASLMPFYCCWLTDIEDESKPCKASVTAASAIYTTRMFGIVYNPEKQWIN